MVLDSAIIRDTIRKHFCCLMTYNNKECGFDGISYRRLSLFDWKDYLNKDEEFTFQGSNFNKPIFHPDSTVQHRILLNRSHFVFHKITPDRFCRDPDCSDRDFSVSKCLVRHRLCSFSLILYPIFF